MSTSVELRKTFGQNVKEIRQEQGITQAELAKFANVQPSYVSQVENARRLPRVDIAIALAEALGISVDSLLYK